MKIKIVNQGHHPLPDHKTIGSAGLDLQANLAEPFTLHRGAFVLIKTGLFVEIPIGYEGQIRPRSGLAFKHGVTVLNSPGTIDADYRGEIGVLLINHGPDSFVINDGERIAQLVVARHETIEWQPVEKLDDTHRGKGGFGSTGK